MSTYQWNQLGINEFTSLYLYGQTSKPTDLLSDAVIRPSGPPPIEMDAVSFMANGPGRFANASQITLIKAFMGGGGAVFQENGQRQEFTLQQAVAILGAKTENLSILQSNYQDASDDLLMRAYVYQTSPYTIARDAVFVIEADGTRHIENFAILPFNEDFDFGSDSLTSTVANLILKPKIDPTDIGHRVRTVFTADSKDAVPRTSYTQASLAADLLRYNATFHPIEGTARVGLAVTSGEYVDGLWNSGVTKILDSAGRAVFHGTSGSETLSPDKFAGLNIYGPLAAAAEQKGIAFIAGAGNDNIYSSVNDDYLDGGTGTDTLRGGIGPDTYVFKQGDGKDTIIDSDGRGLITVAGTTFTGASAADYKLQQNGQGQWSVNNGQTIYTLDEANKRLVISGTSMGADNQITVKLDDAGLAKLIGQDGYLGLKLERAPKAALVQGGNGNVFAATGFDTGTLAGQQSNIVEGTAKTFTVYLNQAAKAGETITLALSAQADKFKAILGDSVVSANGAVITLTEGQTQVSFALIEDGDITADASMNLSATYTGAQGSVTSNAWGVNLQDAGPISQTLNGDFLVRTDTYFGRTLFRYDRQGLETTVLSSGDTYYVHDIQGNQVAGTDSLVSDNVIFGSDANDQINGLSGNDTWSLLGQSAGVQVLASGGDDRVQGGLGDNGETHTNAITYIAGCAIHTRPAAQFGCKRGRSKALEEGLTCGTSTKPAHAHSMRLAGHEGLGRLMEYAPSVSSLRVRRPVITGR